MTDKIPPLIILGSARKNSDTRKLIDKLFLDKDIALLDLLDYKVNGYKYDGNYPASDEFLKLIEVVLQHEQLVFATPVYWYTMSGLMKTFFDRLTDIVTAHKALGRRMAGKESFLLAVGAEDTLPPGFEEPFKLTSAYFHMHFKYTYYARANAITSSLPKTDVLLQLLNL
ncbi:flavodoxin family protein [Pontibacter sp. H249]|uniref:flavodoxin family protein n=1 Tax=Pontibacter sp. H249 TaxID=3133420 RepID=UPI0030BBBD6A